MELLQITAGLIISSLMLAAFFMVLAALFPSRIAHVQATAAAMPGRSVIVGLINWIFFTAVVLGLLTLSEGTRIRLLTVPALAISLIVLVAAIFGLAGVVELIGARLLTTATAPRRTGLGALVLGWACALPFVGWFALLPYVLAMGLGAVILSCWSPPAQPAPSAGEPIMARYVLEAQARPCL